VIVLDICVSTLRMLTLVGLETTLHLLWTVPKMNHPACCTQALSELLSELVESAYCRLPLYNLALYRCSKVFAAGLSAHDDDDDFTPDALMAQTHGHLHTQRPMQASSAVGEITGLFMVDDEVGGLAGWWNNPC
jgi:hypothetical protein